MWHYIFSKEPLYVSIYRGLFPKSMMQHKDNLLNRSPPRHVYSVASCAKNNLAPTAFLSLFGEAQASRNKLTPFSGDGRCCLGKC